MSNAHIIHIQINIKHTDNFMSITDTSHELLFYRFGSGIKLVRPETEENKTRSHTGLATEHTVASLLQLPLSIYFIRADSINANVNEHDATLCGFDSVKMAIGKKCFSNFTQKSAEITTKNDNEVVRTRRIKISEEDVVLSDGNISRPTLSIKFPWYNNVNKIIGLFGCSIILGKHPLADSLSTVTNLGLLNTIENVSSHIGTEIDENYLSKRQLNCAKLLLTGMTTREIAVFLNLSPRTIESYIENIKIKLHCQNKTELIIKLSEYLKK